VPVSPVISSPNIRALGLCALFYFAFGVIIGWLVPRVTPLVGWALLAFLLFAPSVLLGIITKRSPLMHGALLGLLIVGFMAFLIALGGALGVEGAVEGLHQFGSFALGSAMAFVIFSSLGAILGDFIGDSSRRR
jgi:hypothetical protein